MAVSGLTRHTLSSRVPDRPGKLRGTVRNESRAGGGRLAHADAAVATCLVQPRADVNEAGDVAVAHQLLELRPRRRADVERNAVVHAPAATIVAETAKSR